TAAAGMLCGLCAGCLGLFKGTPTSPVRTRDPQFNEAKAPGPTISTEVIKCIAGWMSSEDDVKPGVNPSPQSDGRYPAPEAVSFGTAVTAQTGVIGASLSTETQQTLCFGMRSRRGPEF